MVQPLILRVKRAREEDALDTLVVAAPPPKRRTLDASLAALSTAPQQNVLHRFRRLEDAPVSGYAEAAARQLAVQALKDRKKRRRAEDETATPAPQTKRAALRAVDANGCLELIVGDAAPPLPPPPPSPSPTKRNAVLSPMARRLDAAIVAACRQPYQPGALEAILHLVAENAHGSGANFSRPADGATPLHAAAFVGDASACRMLLSLGADPAVVDEHGLTPSALAQKRSGAACSQLLADALQNRDAAYDYYYLDAVRRGDANEAGIALERAVADALGADASVIPACGDAWTECDGYALDAGAASDSDPDDYDSNAEDAPANDYPDEEEDPWCGDEWAQGCSESDDEGPQRFCGGDDGEWPQVRDDSDEEGQHIRQRFEAVEPSWAEDHPDCLAGPREVDSE